MRPVCDARFQRAVERSAAGRSPASLSACTSACGSPARSWCAVADHDTFIGDHARADRSDSVSCARVTPRLFERAPHPPAHLSRLPLLLEQRVDVILRRERDQSRRCLHRRRRSGSAASDRCAIATATPPFAVPSSLVRTMPVTPATLVNSRACARPFWPTVASRTSSTSCGAPSVARARDPPDLVQLVHQVHARVEATRRVDENRIPPLRLPRLNRIEDTAPPDRRLPSRESMSTLARLAQISSCSTAAARNVSAAQTSGCWPGRLQQVGQLADGRRLSGAIDADNQRHVGMVTIRRRPLDGVEDCRISSFTRSRRLSPCRARERTALTIRSGRRETHVS